MGVVSVWAMAFGCIIGWGAFVLPGTTFIPSAGAMGTFIGVIIATLIGLVFCCNYSWMVHKFPHDRGSYVYTRNILGEDHGFLAAWSILLAYISILWANVSAFTVLFRSFFGNHLQFGFHHNVAGYDVYGGEVTFTIVIFLVLGLMTSFSHKIANFLRTFFAVTLFVPVVILFVGILYNGSISEMFTPAFSSRESISFQIMNIVVFAPFMYVGFEVVTHTVGFVKFPVRKVFRIAAFAIFTGMIVYIFLALTAVAYVPEEYEDTMAYMADLKNTQGLHQIPVFYNVYRIFGTWGLVLIGISAFSALATGVLGFHRGAARVIKIMAKNKILPEQLAEVNSSNGKPVKASLLILFVSIPIMFIGRTAMSWNADVASFAASVVYAYISLCTVKTAKENNHKILWVSGIVGFVISVIIFIFLLIPNIFAIDVITKESYLLFAFWSFIGMVYYWIIFYRDKEYRYGKSTVMWIVMISIFFFSTTMWIQSSTSDEINKVYSSESVPTILMYGGILHIIVVVIATIFLFSLFTIMIKRVKEKDNRIVVIEEHREELKAKNDLLEQYNNKLAAQKQQIEMQKDKIERQRDEIQSSITYAYRIQQALLTPDATINRIFPDHFLFYKPRNVVSGDFYWMEQFGDNKVCVVADCTGHGVPGGFMSMLGMTNLDYIVKEEQNPNIILDKLRDSIISELHQRDEEPADLIEAVESVEKTLARNQDGMDVAIYVINEKTMTLSFAGANNPLVFIHNNELRLIKPDKMPVGIFAKHYPFARIDMPIEKGDCLYTFSDGFQDQLNFDTDRKFMSKHLRDVLLEIHNKPMDEQKEILSKMHDEWRGPSDYQTDDILIFGVRI